MVPYSSRYRSLLIVPVSQLGIKIRLCIEYLTDREFSNIKIVCAHALRYNETRLLALIVAQFVEKE